MPRNEDSPDPSDADLRLSRTDTSLPRKERIRLKLRAIFDIALRRELPLQNETTYFILANVLDFFMTYLLLQLGAVEANPIADFFYKAWGFTGMLAFKLALVAFICVIAQLIAIRNHRYARWVLTGGTAVVGMVVVYSLVLAYGYFR